MLILGVGLEYGGAKSHVHPSWWSTCHLRPQPAPSVEILPPLYVLGLVSI